MNVSLIIVWEQEFVENCEDNKNPVEKYSTEIWKEKYAVNEWAIWKLHKFEKWEKSMLELWLISII